MNLAPRKKIMISQGKRKTVSLIQVFVRRFDCGSGVGTVRSTQTVRLNEWNTLTVYRHRWDAWIQLNQEKRVEGRSKVRMNFRLGVSKKSNDRLSMKGGENRFVDVPRKYLIAAPRLELELSGFMRNWNRWPPIPKTDTFRLMVSWICHVSDIGNSTF